MHTSRRGFISGLGSLFVAAPAIVRAGSLMPIRGERLLTVQPWAWVIDGEGVVISDEALVDAARKALLPRIAAQLYTEPMVHLSREFAVPRLPVE